MGQVLQAKESFVTEVDGKRTVVVAGQTRVDDSNELAARYPDNFEAIKANYGVEDMSDAPGEVRTRIATAQEEAQSPAGAEASSSPPAAAVPAGAQTAPVGPQTAAPKRRPSTTQGK